MSKFSIVHFEKYLADFNNTFEEISKNAENIISSNSYNPADFYGLILCYLNNYNSEQFTKLVAKLMESSKTVLFEIFSIYNNYLKMKIKFESNFLMEFIGYLAEKNKGDFQNFLYITLFYLDDINSFVEIINLNKEKIISINEFEPIPIPNFENYSGFNMKLFRQYFDEILRFSEQQKKLLVFFSNDFWENLKKLYEKPT